METKEENIEMKWEEIQAESKYLKLEAGKPYEIMIKSAKPFRDKKYKDNDGKPKIRVEVILAKLDGKECDLIWTTGSYTVMDELKKCVADQSLTRSVFFLKVKNENGKTRYVFEKQKELPMTEAEKKKLKDVESFL